MLTVKEFAAQIKEQYPVYASWDDDELTTSVIEKYPVYKSWVQIEEKPLSFGVTRGFEAETLPQEQKTITPNQIPLTQLSDNPKIAAMESRFLAISDPKAKAIELRNVPKENGIQLLERLNDTEKQSVKSELEKLYNEDRKANAFALGILESTPIPTFLPEETKKELQKTKEAAPIQSAAGQIAGTIGQTIVGANAIGGVLSKTAIGKSPLLKNALTRLTTSGAIAAEQNIGRKDIGEAIGDVAQQAGGGLVSIVPEILVPAGPLQLIAQPLGDLIYDVAAGKVRGQDIGSKDWWKNEVISLASSAGFAIRDVASGKTFELEQATQREELSKLLKGNKNANLQILTPKEREAKIGEMVSEDIAKHKTPSRSNVIEPESAEFKKETLPSGMEVTRNVRQPPTETDLKTTIDAEQSQKPYINEYERTSEPQPQPSDITSSRLSESGTKTLRPDEAQRPGNPPPGEGDRGEGAWTYGDTRPEVESTLAETSPKTLESKITQKASEEIDRLNVIAFKSKSMRDVNAEMDAKLQNVKAAERKAAQRGSILLPGEGKPEPVGGEEAVARTLEAGRYESLNPAEKIKNSVGRFINTIKQNFTKYKADVEDFPQYRDNRRTQFDPMRRGIFDTIAKYRHASVSNLYKKEGKKGLRRATDILILRNLKLRGEKGQTLENNLTVDQVTKHLEWLEKTSSKEVLDAANDAKTLLKGAGWELVERNKIPAEALEEDYFPHKVFEHIPDFMKGLRTPMNRKFGEPYRPYTKKAVGSKRLIASDDSVIWTHLAKVLADNAQEDWMLKQATTYDAMSKITPEQKKKLYKGAELVIDGKRYKALEWKKTRYKATAVNEGLLESALTNNMLVKDWMATKGPRGGEAMRQVPVTGQSQLYLLPKAIANDLDNLIEKSPPIFDVLYSIGHLTQKWKGMTLTASMLPYQAGNAMGDALSTTVFDPLAHTYLPQASRVATKIFYPDGLGKRIKLNADEQKLFDVASQKDVASSGMSAELRFGPAKGLMEKYKTASEYRESLMRLSILAHQLDRAKNGKPVENLAGIDLKGLDPESAAGKVARETLVDYGAVPRSYQLFLSRGLMPFVRFAEGNFRNYARAVTRNKGTHRAWKTITPIVGAYAAQWAYNNLNEDKKELEMQLPDYMRNRWHINLGKTDEGNITVWAPQQPVDMAMSWLGIDNMNRIASDLKEKRITPKEAAEEFLGAAATGAVENVSSLMNPIVQAWVGLQTNEDPFTHRKIMPDAIHKEGIFSKNARKFTIGFLGEKIFTPILQYNRTKRSTKPDEHPLYDWILKGPLNVKRAFGFYEIDPRTQDIAQHFKIAGTIESDNEYYKTKFYDIIGEYGEDLPEGLRNRRDGLPLTDNQQKAVSAVEKLTATAKDNGFSALNYGNWFKNMTAQRKIIDAELRKTKDKAKRRELLDKKEKLYTASQVQYMKQVPKTARKRYIDEMRKRKALPGEE
jgi:hypothetical protein